MGILKKAILDKILGKVVKGIDLDAITKNAQNGKYDINKMVAIMESLIGKKATDQLLSEVKEKADKGEKVSISTMLDLMKKIDISKIQSKAENGEIDVNNLQSTLTDIVGEKQTNQIFSTFNEEIEKVEKDEDGNN